MLGSLADLAVRHEGEVCVITITGEIDLSNADALQREMSTAASSADRVVVDTGGVQFIDSAGLRMLVGLVNDLDDRGARLRLVVAETSPIARVLSITNFESLMPIDTSVGDACRAIMEPTDSTDPATPPETT